MPIPNYRPHLPHPSPDRSLISRIIEFLHREWSFLRNDKIFIYTYSLMLIKSLVFLGIITSDGTSWLYYFLPFYNGTIFMTLSFNLMFLAIPFLFTNRRHAWALVFLDLIFSLLLITDLMYYRGYGNFVSIYLLQQASNLENLWSSIISMLRPIDAFFVADIVMLIYLLRKQQRLSQGIQRHFLIFVLFITLPITYIYLAHYKYDVVEQGQNRIVFRITWTPNGTMSNLSPIGYHLYDSYVYWKDNQPIHLSQEEEKSIQNWYINNTENLPPNGYQGLFAGQNLILLQVESLENFVLNQKVEDQEITPNLNRLLKNSLYFSNFYEQVWNGTTSDAELMANTSVYPVRRGGTFFRFPNNSYNSLPLLLQEKGYFTRAIHPYKGAYWNWRPALTSFGFDETIDASYFTMDEKIGLGLSDGSYLKQVIPLINESKKPFYTFMITLTSHSPFELPKEYQELKLDPKLNDHRLGGYFQSMQYADKQIGNFLEMLDYEGLLDNTVIVIYGDHGGVHKFYQDEVLAFKPAQDWWLKDDKKVPMLIYKKGMPGKEIKTIGGQIDILPTIAYLMGVEQEKYAHSAMGRNLLNTNKNFVVLGDRTYIGDQTSKAEIDHAVKGINMADKIIQSNYFKEWSK